jgi:undecaprenyl-diphosphatase
MMARTGFGLTRRGCLAVGAVLGMAFLGLAVMVRQEWAPLARLDASVLARLHDVAVDHDGYVTLLTVLTGLGTARVYIPAFAVVVVLLGWPRRARLAAFLATTMAASPAINAIVKSSVGRARPAPADPVASAAGWSFPSGHAQSTAVAYLVLLVVTLPVLSRRWHRAGVVAGAAFMIVAIGFTRIALGVHYLSDVVAGYLLGAAWVAMASGVFAPWPSRGAPGVSHLVGSDRPPSPPAPGVGPSSVARCPG